VNGCRAAKISTVSSHLNSKNAGPMWLRCSCKACAESELWRESGGAARGGAACFCSEIIKTGAASRGAADAAYEHTGSADAAMMTHGERTHRRQVARGCLQQVWRRGRGRGPR
jgi:hypothetical protein